MFAIFFASLLFFPQPSIAKLENGECAKSAMKLVDASLEKALGKSIDRNSVERVMLETFENTTPGSYYQEYEMTFQVVFKPGSVARKSMDGFSVFYSDFVCENLRLISLELNH